MRVARAKIQLGRKLHLADNNRGYLPATTREIAAIGDIYYDSDPSPRNYIYQTYSADGVTPQIPPLSDKPDRGQTAETRMGILSANPYVPFTPPLFCSLPNSDTSSAYGTTLPANPAKSNLARWEVGRRRWGAK